MRIRSLTTFDLACRLAEPFGWAQAWTATRTAQLVRIDTDAGISGWGESSAPAVSSVVHETLAPLLLGADPMSRAELWQRMFHTLYNGGLIGGIGGNAVSAVDIALWDLVGKALDVPIHVLLGGAIRTRVPVYATGLYYRKDEWPDKLPAEARGYVEAGFQGMKTKVGGLSPHADRARVQALREVVGPDVHLMVDANQAFDVPAAIRMGRMLADLDLLWFEEPVHAQDLTGYAQVKAALPHLPLAGGEGLRTRFDCSAYAHAGAVDILQPDVVNVGGITEMQRVIAMANAMRIRVYPHVWGSAVMVAASLHLAATIPPTSSAHTLRPWLQEPIMEFDQTPNALRTELLETPFACGADGKVPVPTGPGLGLTLRQSAVDRYCIAQQTSTWEP